jgi:hypothetical protein
VLRIQYYDQGTGSGVHHPQDGGEL